MAIVTRPGALAFDDGTTYADQRGWWTCCPTCGQSGLLNGHSVEFTEGLGSKPTITPSCVCASCGAHWFVVEGEVRDVA